MTVNRAHGNWAFTVQADLKSDWSATARLLKSVKPDAMITTPADNGTLSVFVLASELDTLTLSRLQLATNGS